MQLPVDERQHLSSRRHTGGPGEGASWQKEQPGEKPVWLEWDEDERESMRGKGSEK